MKYRKNFKKTVWGYFEVEANSLEEAQEKQDSGDYEEFDNKSEYDFKEWEKEE